MTAVILFAFHGREANVALQMPFIRRILDEHPNATFESWNFTRNPSDYAYIQSLAGERIRVRNDLHGEGMPRWGDVFRYYSKPEFRDTLFVKIDDDVTFLETARFGDFVQAIKDHPGAIVSAETINNGASTPLNPDIWSGFEDLDIPLLDVHLSNAYAELAHEHFFVNWARLIGQKVQAIPTDDWVSINAIGLDHSAMQFVGEREGTESPRHIAGRDWPPGQILGDEGACNMLPRVILKGFLAGHLTFGPQSPDDEQIERWRRWYAEIGQRYLG